ncbi:MAG: hypothetical protein HY698_21560 [Deltaproteobacteria bacterium]|nr:hypothetical protein [Deltaproteobacteria bacterium]
MHRQTSIPARQAALLAPPIALLLSWLLLACGKPAVPSVVAVEVPLASGLDLATLTWEPAVVARVDRVGSARVELTVAGPAITLELSHKEACKARVRTEPGRLVEIRLVPLVDLGPDRPQAGFDAEYEIVARAGCTMAEKGVIAWRQIAGPDAGLRVEERGFRVRGRTPALATIRPGTLPWGIVPFSPASRGEQVLEAVWRADGHEVRRVLRVAPTPRATGGPGVGVNHLVTLGGHGWQIKEGPPSRKAQIALGPGFTTLTPDLEGVWTLVDAAGEELSLNVGRFDTTPLDCGRGDCHPAEVAAAARGRMVRVLAWGLEGELGPSYDPRCAIACHSVGEPGLDDGGFASVAQELGWAPPSHGRPRGWVTAPAPVRRLAGVGCGGCHGPGAIPARKDRWSALRADTCAACHDAPPRYGHVAAWARTAMAKSDATQGTREAECASCHTTAGFLSAIGARPTREWGTPPASVGPIGIACAACHAAHGKDTGRALIRQVPAVESLKLAGAAAKGVSGVCVPCHAPRPGESRPGATAAALWLGGAGVSSAGDPLKGPAAHAEAGVGCVDCHAAGDGKLTVERGAGHEFRSDKKRCEICHDAGDLEEKPGKDGRRVAERAALLWARLGHGPARPGAGNGRQPPHAEAASAIRDRVRQPAEWNVLLVLEDPAAGVHNAAYARLLLDEAEKALGEMP